VSKSISGMRRSNPMALWVTDSDSATAISAVMWPSLRAATATRVWHRQSIACSDAVRAAEPTAMPRSMSRRLQVGPVNSSSSDCLRSSFEACRNSAQVVGRRCQDEIPILEGTWNHIASLTANTPVFPLPRSSERSTCASPA
jgi:hypothetical protein